MHENLIKAQKALNDELIHFMPRGERLALKSALLGEEGEHMAKVVLDIAERIKGMPKTYETDKQGGDAIAYLHYFGGSVDAWVTEKDAGSPDDDPDARGMQVQAFGKVDLGYGAELGYICIQELIDNGIELDLYFQPSPLKECGV